MRSPSLPLRSLALSLVLLGCGASVSRFDTDVPAATVDTAVIVDTPAAVDSGLRPDAGARPDVVTVVDSGFRPDVPTAVDGGPGPMCTLRGSTWDVDLEGMRALFEFTMDSRWVVSAEGRVVASGVYEIEGGNVVLTGEMSDNGCSPTDRGTFQLRFSPDCEQLQLAVVHDDCADRGQGLDRFRFTRR
jgi:hypothetical protein